MKGTRLRGWKLYNLGFLLSAPDFLRTDRCRRSNSSDRQHTFEKLLPCTVHVFRIRGWTSAGNGTFFSLFQNMTTPSAGKSAHTPNVFSSHHRNFQMSNNKPQRKLTHKTRSYVTCTTTNLIFVFCKVVVFNM